jgi:hypothetical protein
VLVDRTGELSHQIDGLEHAPPDRGTPEMAARLAANFANGVLFGLQVLARGEAARSLEVLVFTLRYLEWLARLVEGNVAHWPTPSRRWERDLSAEAQARLIDCTARSSRAELARAYRNAWAWGRSLAETLAQRHGLLLPDALYDRISQRVNASPEGLVWQ